MCCSCLLPAYQLETWTLYLGASLHDLQARNLALLHAIGGVGGDQNGGGLQEIAPDLFRAALAYPAARTVSALARLMLTSRVVPRSQFLFKMITTGGDQPTTRVRTYTHTHTDTGARTNARTNIHKRTTTHTHIFLRWASQAAETAVHAERPRRLRPHMTPTTLSWREGQPTGITATCFLTVWLLLTRSTVLGGAKRGFLWRSRFLHLKRKAFIRRKGLWKRKPVSRVPSSQANRLFYKHVTGPFGLACHLS